MRDCIRVTCWSHGRNATLLSYEAVQPDFHACHTTQLAGFSTRLLLLGGMARRNTSSGREGIGERICRQ